MPEYTILKNAGGFMDHIRIRDYVQGNPRLVKARRSVAFPELSVIKYTKRTFWEGAWNDILEQCRGTVVDDDYNIVARPFTKIYNFRVEPAAPSLPDDTKVTAYRKVNGFMVALTWYQDRVLVSTTGSLESEFVDLAWTVMLAQQPREVWDTAVRHMAGKTCMFECVASEDPHIIPEQPGMYFLGFRYNSWDSIVSGHGSGQLWNSVAELFGCHAVPGFETTVGELVDLTKTVQHEGFVFYTQDNVSAKIKSPWYLTSKFLARAPRTDKLMRPNIKQSLDEEFYPLIDAIQANITEYTAWDEQTRLAWIRGFLQEATAS